MAKRSREGAEAEEEEEPVVVEEGGSSGAGEASAASGAGSSSQSAAARDAAAARRALTELPCSEMYEKSYMHRDWVTHVVTTASDFLITASRDGQLKFWKKMQTGIEFIKHFRAHLQPFTGVAASPDGSLLATAASDKGLKVFDVLSFDMINWIRLDFSPGGVEWISGPSAAKQALHRVRPRGRCARGTSVTPMI